MRSLQYFLASDGLFIFLTVIAVISIGLGFRILRRSKARLDQYEEDINKTRREASMGFYDDSRGIRRRRICSFKYDNFDEAVKAIRKLWTYLA